MSGRRAAFRVAFKSARRNKKRTFFLVVLIALPVMVAVVVAAGVRANYISPEELAKTQFGSTNVRVELWSASPEVRSWFLETIDEIEPDASTIGYRVRYASFAPSVSGQVTDIDLDDPLSDGILTLTEGSRADEPGEVVLTEHLAAELEVGLNNTVALRLRGSDETDYHVVGLASHPVSWRLDEAVVAPTEMDLIAGKDSGDGILLVDAESDSELSALLQQRWEESRFQFYPGHVTWPIPDELSYLPEEYYAAMTADQLDETLTIAVEEGEQAASEYAYSLFPNGASVRIPQGWPESLTDRLSWDQTTVVERAPVIGTGVAAAILAEVAFIAGAAFATGTRRRLREIGLIGANGGATGHIKASVVGEGLTAGLLGAVLGSLLALGLLIAGRPLLQRFVERRIEEFPLTPADLVGPVVVAVVACVVAAWLPARTAAAVPTLTALQGRMPVGRPKRWTIPFGLSITGFGALLLGVGLAASSGGGAVVAVIGTLLMIGGVALLAGPIVAWISGHAERFPITSRIVLRDSGRQRGRAAAAVAATMVILMAPVGALIALDTGAASEAIYGLPEDDPQILIEGAFDDVVGIYEEREYSDADLAALRAILPDARIAEFEVLDLRVEYPAELEARKAGSSEDEGGYYINPHRVGVANAELLALLDDQQLEQTLARDGMVLIGVEERESTVAIEGIETKVAEIPLAVQRWSFPRILVTESVASTMDASTSLKRALVEIEAPLFANPFSSPFDRLWQEGDLQLMTSGGGSGFGRGTMVAMLFLATMIVVLIVVATITALSAAEADSDLKTVVAVGATNSIRRRYLGLQSGLHTLIAVLLAVPLTLLLGKTLMLANNSYQTVGSFDVWQASTLIVPWPGILVLVVGLPVLIGLVTVASVRSAPTTPPRRAT
jgi:ABC-type antimicrobial peptide transport system permease subunit